MIAIVDYDVGNVKNVYNAFEKLGLQAKITSDIEIINKSSAIVLPGVGAFKDAMDNLKKNGLKNCIVDNAKNGKIILGICLGMQLLFERSFEDGVWDGLGLLKGDVVKFDNNLKVPHMGWNSLIRKKMDPIGKNIGEEYVYFVHSYYLESKNVDDVVFWTEYGARVPAIVRKNNIIGMQFHPEKSGSTGIKLLQNFKELIQ